MSAIDEMLAARQKEKMALIVDAMHVDRCIAQVLHLMSSMPAWQVAP